MRPNAPALPRDDVGVQDLLDVAKLEAGRYEQLRQLEEPSTLVDLLAKIRGGK